MLLRLILAIPILLMPNLLYLPLDTGIPAINLANLLLIAVVVALLLSPRDPVAGHTPGLLTAPLMLYFFALLVSFYIATTDTTRPLMDDVTELKNVVFYPLLYFAYRRCKQDMAGTRQLIMLALAVAVVAGLDSLRQGLATDALSSFVDTNRVAGPFGDYRSANRAGVFFAMFLPLFAGFALFLPGRRLCRLLSLAACVVIAAAILLTYSRQAYLISLIALALLLVRRSVVLAALLAIAAVPAIALLPEGVTQRVAETQQYSRTGRAELDVSTASRFDIWKGAVHMWSDHPAGVGLDRFPRYIGEYSDYANYDAHNMYVLMLAETGPLGLLALLWIIWRMLRLALALRRSSEGHDAEVKALSIGFTAAVVAMAMGNLFGSPFNEGLVMANFWILCGLVERYTLLQHQDRAVASVPQADPHLTGLHAIASRFPLSERIQPGRYRALPK